MAIIANLISSLFWAIFFSTLLWVSCVYWGRLLKAHFRPDAIHHILCFVIAIFSCILFVFIINLNRASNMVKEIQEASVVELLKQTSLPELEKTMKKQYPIISKYIDLNNIFETETYKQELIKTSNLSAADQAQSMITTTLDLLTDSVQSKINAVKYPLIATLVVLQLLAFGIITYAANQMSKPLAYKFGDYNHFDGNTY